MITSSPTKRIFSNITVKKHLSEFYPQDDGESQLASKLRHCHPMYKLNAAHKSDNTLMLCVFCFVTYAALTFCGAAAKRRYRSHRWLVSSGF